MVGVIALSLIAVTPASPAAAAPTSPYTVFSLTDRWDVVGTPATASHFSLQQYGAQGFILNMSYAGNSYSAIVTAPTGQTLSPATFPARRMADATHGALDVSGQGSGCNETAGSVTVHEVSRDPGTGDFTSIAVTYQQTSCFPVKGEIRWHSARGYTVAIPSTRTADFGSLTAGEETSTKTVTFRSLGSADLVLGAAAIEGSNPESFSIGEDTCSGATLTYDQTCSVEVISAPQALGALSMTLALPGGIVGGKETVSLTANGLKSNRGTFYPLAPQRVLDTREGNGAPKGPVGSGAAITLQVAGRGGVPATGVAAVVLNVTVTGPTSAGHVTVWPAGVSRPVASSLNFTAGWTGANSVTVALGAGGRVSLFNSAGSTHLIADVTGWYADSTTTSSPGGLLQYLTPRRSFDSRVDWREPLPAGYYLELATNFGPEENEHVKAWVVNVTATSPSGSGYLTAWDGYEGSRPATSTLNYAAGQTVSNFAVVPAGRCWSCAGEYYGAPMIGVYTSATTHLIVDMFAVFDDGWYTGGLRLSPKTPVRIVDSRNGQGVPGALGQGVTGKVVTPPALLDENTHGLALNVTAIQPTVSTFLTVWPHGVAQPTVSNLNPARGQIVPNAVITELGADNAFDVYNNGGSTHVAIDVVGTYFWYPFGDPSGPSLRGQAGPDATRYLPGRTVATRR